MYKNKKNILSADTDEKLWHLWEEAIAGKEDITTCMRKEIKDYLKISNKEIDEYWGEKGTKRIKEDWEKSNPKTPEDIVRFYEKEYIYIPELTSWHCQKLNDTILEIVKSLVFAVKHKCNKFLDYGCGIGSSGLFFHYYGFEIELADISSLLLNFAKYRFQIRGIRNKVRFNDLKEEKISKDNYYDFVSVVEVLEHVTDPVQVMAIIHKAMLKNGYVFLTTPFFHDIERPQHIITDFSIIPKMKEIGYREISVSYDGVNRIWQKI